MQHYVYGNKAGAPADLQPGCRVTVTYEAPPGGDIARVIAQTSQRYTGSLTAIDLADHTLKARAAFGAMKFNLAADCAVVLNGKSGAELTDIRLGDRLVLDYDQVNGINIVNRIATVEGSPDAMTASSSASPHQSGMPASSGY